MFIRKIKRSNDKISIQIVATQRDKATGKVKQKVLENIGTYSTSDEIEAGLTKAKFNIKLREIEQKGLFLSYSDNEIEGKKDSSDSDIGDTFNVKISDLGLEQTRIQGVKDIFGQVYDDMGFCELIDCGRKSEEFNDILKSSVLSRIHTPVSKRKLSELILNMQSEFIPVHKMYRMLDRLSESEEQIKAKICRSTLDLFDNKIDVAFFDVTTLYFESLKQDELKDFGFSKDCKFKEVQVVLALITTTGGVPLGYELFEGNKNEGKTFISSINKFRKMHNLSNMFIVADRAMFSKENLMFLDSIGVSFVVAAKLKGLNKKKQAEILEGKKAFLSKEGDVNKFTMEFDNDGYRLVVSYSSERAKKDAKDRARLVDRLKKYEKDGIIRLKDLIKNNGTKKFLKIDKNNKDIATVNLDKINKESEWDGLHGVVTNNKESTSEDLLSRYKGLWQIEEAFRINKNDLKMRPIFHWKPRRVRAHILFCYIAYAVASNAKFRLNKIGLGLSFNKIREELSNIQLSIVRDSASGKRFAIPKVLNDTQKRLYKVFGVKYFDQAIALD